MPEPAVRTALAAERDALLAWLDRGLRDDRLGRLAAEYGAALDEPGAVHSAVATVGERFVAHALARRVEVVAGGAPATVGLVGLVYTEPAFRRRGLAARCIRACEAWLAAEGAELAVLWSDRHAWYRGLGYHLAGVERMFTVDSATCRRATRALPFAGTTRPADSDDWPTLERLYERHGSRAVRRPGYLASLAAGPDSRTWVARRDDEPVAYAALGRGDDFSGVVHEWAGSADGVLACLAALCTGSGPIAVMMGPAEDRLGEIFTAAGAPERRGGFGLVRVIEPSRLWSRLCDGRAGLADTSLSTAPDGFRLSGAAGARGLDGAEATRLLLDPDGIELARGALDGDQLRSLSATLPWPIFVWGFDSI